MKKYEYKVLRVGNKPVEDISKMLNSIGEEGYQLVAVDSGLYVFERAIDGRRRAVKRKILS